MSYEPVFNSTDGPIVVDDEGRVLGGGEHGVVDVESTAAAGALEAGLLVLNENPSKEQKQQATALNKEQREQAKQAKDEESKED